MNFWLKEKTFGFEIKFSSFLQEIISSNEKLEEFLFDPKHISNSLHCYSSFFQASTMINKMLDSAWLNSCWKHITLPCWWVLFVLLNHHSLCGCICAKKKTVRKRRKIKNFWVYWRTMSSMVTKSFEQNHLIVWHRSYHWAHKRSFHLKNYREYERRRKKYKKAQSYDRQIFKLLWQH